MNQYNLLEEPWIDVVDNNGSIKSIGIEELLTDAHNFQEIVDSSPLMKYGVYRFLIAFVIDTFQIKNKSVIKTIFKKGKFNPETVKTYCEKYSHRFFLFSDDYPFYQNVNIKKIKKINYIPSLLHHISSGNNPIFFYLSFED